MGFLARFTQAIRDELRAREKFTHKIKADMKPIGDAAFSLWLLKAYEWEQEYKKTIAMMNEEDNDDN